MKRYEVVVTTIPNFHFQLMGIHATQTVFRQYRWRWLARLNAFLFNAAPRLSILSMTVASVRPILRVVEAPHHGRAHPISGEQTP